MFSLRIKYLSFFFGLISILSFFNVIYSYYLNLYLNLNTYYISLIISLVISILFYKLEKPKDKTTIFEKILTVFFGYLTIPLILSLPFYFSIYNLTLLNSFFKSISGFTSTGFTIFENIKHIDQSLILWRSTSQWIGGIYFLFSILLLIDIFDDNLKKTLTNFLSFNTSEIFKQSLKLFIFYSFLTLIIFILLSIFQIRSFNSFNLALTLISSGGFLPSNNLNLILNNEIKQIIFSICMLFSFFSLFLVYNLTLYKKKGIKFLQEDIYQSHLNSLKDVCSEYSRVTSGLTYQEFALFKGKLIELEEALERIADLEGRAPGGYIGGIPRVHQQQRGEEFVGDGF